MRLLALACGVVTIVAAYVAGRVINGSPGAVAAAWVATFVSSSYALHGFALTGEAIGGALFQTLRRFYGTDHINFTFVSDEFNGTTVDNGGKKRAYRPQTFATFSEAEEQNGQSRIYLGIHWSFDKTAGIAQGRSVADYVFDNIFTPLPQKAARLYDDSGGFRSRRRR